LYHINWSTNSSFTVTTLLNGKHIWRILDFISMCIFSSFVIVLSKDHCNSQFKHLISTDCTGSCKSHYHTITTMTASKNCQWHHLLKFCFKWWRCIVDVFSLKFKHILFAQMCKKNKTQAKQTYEVFSHIQ
jgi:hypothetical protein